LLLKVKLLLHLLLLLQQFYLPIKLNVHMNISFFLLLPFRKINFADFFKGYVDSDLAAKD
jgi:hypothetical protein